MDTDRPRTDSLRDEAQALLTANQRARHVALLVMLSAVATVAVGAAIALGGSERVLTVTAPFSLLLAAVSFQLYAEVSVLGAARAHLERQLMDLGEVGVMYERDVAPLRQGPPLVRSVRLVQTATSVLVAAGVTAGIVVAVGDTLAVAGGTIAATALSLAAAAFSYRDMLRSGAIAQSRLDRGQADSRA